MTANLVNATVKEISLKLSWTLLQPPLYEKRVEKKKACLQEFHTAVRSLTKTLYFGSLSSLHVKQKKYLH